MIYYSCEFPIQSIWNTFIFQSTMRGRGGGLTPYQLLKDQNYGSQTQTTDRYPEGIRNLIVLVIVMLVIAMLVIFMLVVLVIVMIVIVILMLVTFSY